MSTKQQEQLRSQMNAEDQIKLESGELIHREQVENTPFWIVGNEENGYFLTIGKYRITEHRTSIDGVKNDLENKKWYIILTLIGIITEQIIYKKDKKQIPGE